jgi:putative nucleotidyltransferase with HDIG domain
MTTFDASRYRILCVDDEPNILSALRRMLSMQGYQVGVADTGSAALQMLGQDKYDVIICDMRMPQMTGVEVLEQACKRSPLTMRLLLTGAADHQDTIEAINRGQVYRYLGKPWNDAELLAVIRSAIEMAEINRAKEMRLRASYVTSIKAYSGLMALRRPDLLAHSRRVANLSRRVARKMGLDEEQVQEIYIAGLLHDVGKIGLLDRILDTKFIELPLSDAKLYKRHPEMGQTCLRIVDELQEVGRIVRGHHEYYDGTGFPDRLEGDAIPLGARIVGIVEAFEELISGDYGQKQLSPKEALKVVETNSGKLFCPRVTQALLAVMQELMAG